MLSGACGHTYGDHNIWQMWLPGRPPKSVARTPWPEALHHPGSQQMKYFRRLFEARPFWRMESDPSLIVGDNPKGVDHVRAAQAENGTFAVAYLPTGKPVTLNLEHVSGDLINACWFNPRQNSSQLIGTFKRTAGRAFTPPSSGRSNDWVLVVDDASTGLPRLGWSYQHIKPVVKE